MHVASLHLYPVKSLRGLSPDSLEIDALGAVGDRRLMVVDPDGLFLTQRTLAGMALVGTSLQSGHLVLTCERLDPLRVPQSPDPDAPTKPVTVWKSEGLQAEDCGGEAAEWLSRALGTSCRLVRIGPAFHRPVTKAAARAGELVSFADAAPLLLTTTASLDDLNARLLESGAEPVPMNRFRPNLVVSGSAAFEEDRWQHIRIGTVVFRSLGPCARCVVTATDQLTGERGIEPLATLSSYRRDPREPTHVNFGQNLVNETKAGVLCVGDPVEILD